MINRNVGILNHMHGKMKAYMHTWGAGEQSESPVSNI